MQLIGLTGGIASGKSTVSRMLRKSGATVLDADAIYHELIQPRGGGEPSPLAAQIAERFPGVLQKDGEIDRKLLGERVFGDADALRALGELTHPAVAKEVARRVEELSGQGLSRLVYDVPLLFERGLEKGMTAVITVWIPRELQLKRLMERDNLDPEAAERRLASQMSLDEKREKSDYVIDNSRSLDETRDQVDEVWDAICVR